jgi:hypothetical protein
MFVDITLIKSLIKAIIFPRISYTRDVYFTAMYMDPTTYMLSNALSSYVYFQWGAK